MRLSRMHWFGIIAGILLLAIDFIFFLNEEDMNLFIFLVGITMVVICLPFVVSIVVNNQREQEMSEMFLEFSRNLAESVATGTPISKSIINMKNKNYGGLSPHVQKLANQIQLGIPVEKSLKNFSYDVNSPVISRAIALISEAEKAGGEIDYILESVAKSISEVEKLKKERRAAISNLIVQGYIIFFIFIGIMLVMEFKILPLTEGVGSLGLFNGDISNIDQASLSQSTYSPEELSRPFLFLLLTQGFFAGLTIGKLTEGSVKAGVKHSFILTIAAFLISSGARLFLG
ncbi:type II secretion system F family protein [Candidatus Pacearchaeota archaeon]|nr:type II secretion system F family protein [Candidatus Pacearchaeota archaeon]